MRTVLTGLAALVLLGSLPSPAPAYVDGTPTLGRIIGESTTIVVMQVEKVNLEKKAILFKKVADLKGAFPGEQINQQIIGGTTPREARYILNWAEPGKLAVFFTGGAASMTCIGNYWYQCSARGGPWWGLDAGRPELSYAYSGPPEKLRQHVSGIVANQEVVITAVKHVEGRWATYANVAFKDILQGKDWPVWRIKASLQMPAVAFQVSREPRWIVGDGAAGPEDVPRLIQALQSKDDAVRRTAAADIGLIGPPAKSAIRALATALSDLSPLVRIAAAEAHVRVAPHPAPLGVLQDELKSKETHVRKAAAEALGQLGPEAKPAVAALAALLKDAEPAVRWAAAEALGQNGADAEPAVPALVEALADAATRPAAVEALGRIGPKAAAAVPALARLLKEDPEVRWPAVLALGRLGPEGAKIAIPQIVPALKSGDEKTRWDATIILWTIGPDARDAVPALAESIRAGNEMAIDALSAVDMKSAVPFLIRNRLKHSDVNFRKMAADVLGNAGPLAKEAIPALTEALKDGDEAVRLAAAAALKKIPK